MSGLLDAVSEAICDVDPSYSEAAMARAAVEAVAAWFIEEGALATAYERSWAASILRAQLDGPPTSGTVVLPPGSVFTRDGEGRLVNAEPITVRWELRPNALVDVTELGGPPFFVKGER